MSATVDQLMMLTGYGVVIALIIILTAIAAAVIWMAFPARISFGRDLPSHLDTPYGPHRLTLLTGISSRRKTRWFFGLIFFQEGEAPRPKVTARKAA